MRELVRRRPPFERQALLEWLSLLGLAWEPMLALEARLGGCGGRDLYIGVEGDFGQTIGGPSVPRLIEGRARQLMGWNTSTCWYIDEGGSIVEVDDLGHLFHRADSLEKRIEQVAISDLEPGHYVHQREGFMGARLAEALALEPLPEPSDSAQRYWATRGWTEKSAEVIVVRETREPIDYGVSVMGDFTWIGAGTARVGNHPDLVE